MNFEDLKNPELQEKLKSVKTAEELLALAKNEGIDLSDEQLTAIFGGEEWYEPRCRSHRDCAEIMHPPV